MEKQKELEDYGLTRDKAIEQQNGAKTLFFFTLLLAQK